jgi:hypothetical protein
LLEHVDPELTFAEAYSLSASYVNQSLRHVLDLMRRGGFAIEEEVNVIVDRDLPFMGYTSRRWQQHMIVVSGFAVRSGMLQGLLAHELSHVYRNVTNHPSHNDRITSQLTSSFINSYELDLDYQREILRQVINHVQDLYADDITMKVLATDNGLFDSGQLESFFVEWIKDVPVRTGDGTRDRWANAAIMLNNSFALSNMQRHSINDHEKKAKSKSDSFLTHINHEAAKEFSYFNDFMVGLKEQVTEAEFQQEMKEYLTNFFRVVRNI